ncbi:hypothetical protein HYDPIDRAFT_122059 [Hydnomerulius pinastri MD-312]|nr:hypothetical protein HYDPIDRAFT_122059 [Hydnomerulius pinastri MD-312]
MIANDTPQRDNILLRRPAITTFVVLATFLTPFAVLPYVLNRRRTSHLSTKLDQLVASNAALARSLSRSLHEKALRKEELRRATSLLEEAKKEIHFLRRDISQIQAQHEAFEITSRTWALIPLHSHLYRECLDVLPRLGISLADIAAFMHEVELHQGLPSSAMDDHGVEKLRMLALKLQKSPAGNKVGS